MSLSKTDIAVITLSVIVVAGFGFGYARNKQPVMQPVANAVSTDQVCSSHADGLLALVNSERQALGSPVVTIDPTLATAASQKLDDMVANEYYGHNLPDGSSTFVFERNLGIHAALSEDLDVNAPTAEADWTTFKNSPVHYKSLTNPAYTRIGIATQCGLFAVRQGTGPDDNSRLNGKIVTEYTVVELAAPEPAAL